MTDSENFPSIAEVHHSVLDYLQKEKAQYPEVYSKLMIKATNPNDIAKYIKNDEIIRRWDFEYYHRVELAIDYIYDDLIMGYEFPKIEAQTLEDVTLAKILKNPEIWVPISSDFLFGYVTLSHIIAFLNRDNEIFNWNTRFLILVMKNVTKVKELLLNDKDESLTANG
jgi:hypothetical protein